MKQTRFTTHALTRLKERTCITPRALGAILDGARYILLAEERASARQAKLFFSRIDDKFFIASQDRETGFVVTILTIEYLHNLSERYFSEKKIVTRDDLLRAIQLGDPDNKLVKHPPLFNGKVFNFQGEFINKNDLFEKPKFLNLGSIKCDLFQDTGAEDLHEVVMLKFYEKLTNKEVSVGQLISIRWGLGKDLKLNEIEMQGESGFTLLIKAVKNDLFLRNNLFKKYEDFLEVLNRQKVQVGSTQP